MWTRQEDLARPALRTDPSADVVVWPETMVPVHAAGPLVPGRPLEAFEFLPGGRGWAVTGRARERLVAVAGGRPTLAGIMTADRITLRKRNTAVLLDGRGTVVAHQDKQHLTPGGETLLFLEWLPGGLRREIETRLRSMAGFLPDLDAGEGTTVLPLETGTGTTRLGVLICYESIFPSLSRDAVGAGADVLVNLSNYGWFAGTSEMDQALAMARFRAAELRRSLVLASNNGISAVIGPDGQVRERTAADVEGTLVAPVPVAGGRTPFAVVGEWAAWALGALGAVLASPRFARTSGLAHETS